MGAKEDLVRARLAQQARDREAERKATEERQAAEVARFEQQYNQLIADINHEAERVATLLEGANWSKAELRPFILPKKHSWQRASSVEYACLMFEANPEAQDGQTGALWMRSDGVLLVSDHYGELFRPSSWIGFSASRWQYFDLEDKLQKVLARLRAFELNPLAHKLP